VASSSRVTVGLASAPPADAYRPACCSSDARSDGSDAAGSWYMSSRILECRVMAAKKARAWGPELGEGAAPVKAPAAEGSTAGGTGLDSSWSTTCHASGERWKDTRKWSAPAREDRS
jgi:hypothetical protein